MLIKFNVLLAISVLPLILFLISCAETHMAIRNPVVFIPGIMGSHLQVEGEDVWGELGLGSSKPVTPRGAKKISLPLEVPEGMVCEPKAEKKVLRNYDARYGLVSPLGGAYFYAVKPIYDSFYVFLESLGYWPDTLPSSKKGMGFTLESKMEIPEGLIPTERSSCLSFYYDWRRDNIENACLLGRFLKRKRQEIVRATRKEIRSLRATGKRSDLAYAERLVSWLEKPFKFDVIAHSMGGLIARYYLRYGVQDIGSDGQLPNLNWAGENDIDKLILVGTPNLGAPVAMKHLLEGYTIPKLEKLGMYYQPSIIGSMPSMYQLLPRTQLGWILDPQGDPLSVYELNIWEKNHWGLLAMDDNPVSRAVRGKKDFKDVKNYLQWCLRRAERFHKALDIPGEPLTTKIYSISGILFNSLLEIRAQNDEHGLLEFDWLQQYMDNGGDGTVPVFSALLYDYTHGKLRQSGSSWIVPGEHLQLMNHKGVFRLIQSILEPTVDGEEP